MKRSDIITVIVIAAAGALASFFILNALLGDPNTKSVSFKTITVISKDLQTPNPEIFNANAINPTVEVYVGECEDVDQNGILDSAELVACGKEAPEGGEQKPEEENKAEETQTEEGE